MGVLMDSRRIPAVTDPFTQIQLKGPLVVVDCERGEESVGDDN